MQNVNTCKDRACSECAAERAAEDGREVAGVARHMLANGWGQFTMTPTIRHGFGEQFRRLRDGMDASWNDVFQGRWWRDVRALCGDIVFVRRFESTFGVNGHHPHYHALLWVEREAERVYRVAKAPTRHRFRKCRARSRVRWERVRFEEWFAGEFSERFADAVEKHMGTPNVPFGAYALRFERSASPEDAAHYIAKAAMEVAAQTTKTNGKNPSMPFGVIGLVRELRVHEEKEAQRGRDAVGTREHRHLLESALHDWRDGSKSTTTLSWSKKLTPVRELVAAEQSEEKKRVDVAAFVPAGYSSRVLAREGWSLLWFAALAAGESAATLRDIFVRAQADERRESAARAWDREQRRWERTDAGEWVERSQDEWNG